MTSHNITYSFFFPFQLVVDLSFPAECLIWIWTWMQFCHTGWSLKCFGWTKNHPFFSVINSSGEGFCEEAVNLLVSVLQNVLWGLQLWRGYFLRKLQLYFSVGGLVLLFVAFTLYFTVYFCKWEETRKHRLANHRFEKRNVSEKRAHPPPIWDTHFTTFTPFKST